MRSFGCRGERARTRRTALLAGRKLLVADESVAVQKIVALTFADEGMMVVTASDGEQAIETLRWEAPDIVLVDVNLPRRDGYEICAYVKSRESLRHVPVLLLVSVFEPFNEAEARKVGADGVLTKPFQSIRDLVSKVGNLLGGKPAEEASEKRPEDAAEKRRSPQAGAAARATTGDLATDDRTIKARHAFTEAGAPSRATDSTREQANVAPVTEVVGAKTMPLDFQADAQPIALEEEPLEMSENESVATQEADDFVLDLGDDVGASPVVEYACEEAFVLELDDEPMAAGAVEQKALIVERAAEDAAIEESVGSEEVFELEIEPLPIEEQREAGTYVFQEDSTREKAIPTVSDEAEASVIEEATVAAQSPDDPGRVASVARVPEAPAPNLAVASAVPDERREAAIVAGAQQASTTDDAMVRLVDQLPPEAIDAIARRVVERISERVVQEIAWEVVPQLAELMIKRQLEEERARRQ